MAGPSVPGYRARMIVVQLVVESRGPSVVTFDGQVVEWFHSTLDPQWRFHLAVKTIGRVEGPSKRGLYRMPVIRRDSAQVLTWLDVDEENLARLRPLLDAVWAAG